MEIFIFFLAITFPLIVIFGFSSVNYKLKKQLENQKLMIEKLDLLIDHQSNESNTKDSGGKR